MNITLNFNPADKADLAQAQLVLTALGGTPSTGAGKPAVNPVVSTPVPPKAAPAVPPKPVKATPPPEEPAAPADEVNDQPSVPDVEAKMTQMRDLAKKLILKNRAALATLFTKYKVKLLSEIKPADLDNVIAEIESELL